MKERPPLVAGIFFVLTGLVLGTYCVVKLTNGIPADQASPRYGIPLTILIPLGLVVSVAALIYGLVAVRRRLRP